MRISSRAVGLDVPLNALMIPTQRKQATTTKTRIQLHLESETTIMYLSLLNRMPSPTRNQHSRIAETTYPTPAPATPPAPKFSVVNNQAAVLSHHTALTTPFRPPTVPTMTPPCEQASPLSFPVLQPRGACRSRANRLHVVEALQVDLQQR